MTLSPLHLVVNWPVFTILYSIAVAQHAFTQRSKGQRSRSHNYNQGHTDTIVRLLVTISRIPHTNTPLHVLPAAVAGVGLQLCMSIRLPMFSG